MKREGYNFRHKKRNMLSRWEFERRCTNRSRNKSSRRIRGSNNVGSRNTTKGKNKLKKGKGSWNNNIINWWLRRNASMNRSNKRGSEFDNKTRGWSKKGKDNCWQNLTKKIKSYKRCNNRKKRKWRKNITRTWLKGPTNVRMWSE